ncbi:dipeptidase [Pseudovibrio exalbescens]|uniref:dipeptidase n=1 Tax=Pseudovibrio exalbescens TaxID=197461 RepID=UPI0023656108|nr:dipeptidase [Pseudovibrio exalbescens]MDD7909185.1 dipeptidase [Pseudovibrio exalbescens]
MSAVNQVLNRIDQDIDASVERLFDLLRIKSISTDPEYKQDCRSAAQWLADELTAIGIPSQVRDTTGHPMVVGHRVADDKPGPHVLFYGHYDVQPVDPIELWDNDPFEPRIVTRDDGSKIIVARGANDDKGQLMTFVEAARAWIAETGDLPISVTVMLEGEEESGSPSLKPFLDANKDELSVDLALVCDTNMWDRETPAITVMLRGLVGEEITLRGPDKDLHSGMYGGAARNPLHVLSDMVAGLRDETGRITLPNFYDGVIEMPEDVMTTWGNLGFSEQEFLGGVGLKNPGGEQDRTVLEQIWTRPTCEVNGLWGGYNGQGFKTVIPSEAYAKISFRLVGDQDPLKIREAFRSYLKSKTPEDFELELHPHGGDPALRMAFDAPALDKGRQALTEEWDKPAALICSGGSIPIVGLFKNVLEMDSLLIGFGLDDDQIHSPNEKYEFNSFHKGIRSWARVLDALSKD